MIEIVYVAPCDYDRMLLGYAEATVAYTGEYPVATAERYVRQVHPMARLCIVVKDKHIWLS